MRNSKKSRQQFLSRVISIAKFGAIAYLCVCIALFFLQTRLIFVPTSNLQKTPLFFQTPYQEIWIPAQTQSRKIERIHSWWLPARDRQPLGTLLYLHGKGLNMGANITQAYRFQQLGLSVLLIDYRGYGRSEGSFPNESQMYQDAETAWNYLVKNKGISPNQIFIYGHSLGGAIAIELALKHPEANGSIVQSSFTSMEKMVERYSLFRLFPIKLILTQRFDSVAKVKSLRLPILFIHGTDDPLIPVTMSKILYANAPQPKQLLLVPKARHNNGDLFFNNREYRETIIRFVEDAGNRKS